ncbi:UDP-N-acetylglucosamine transporter-like [Uloborus diversus]|uniref:UDP-N-acetylglucosamine transporter-like n=1 Tax=Uloborus diversus TaxID=327109 RepID=UPI0024098783|nr:UDP-N-acetylglucosamine transporter-like [Uloborus diversus]
MNDKKEECIILCDPNRSDLPVAQSLYNGTQKILKYTSLVCLTVQNAALNLTMRIVRTQSELFLSSTAVVMAEIIKLLACLFMVGAADEGSFGALLIALKRHIIKQPFDTLKVAVPSFVYLLQNNLLYVGATHLDAATCQVTYQLKILTTAVFSVVMLNRRLHIHQWFALFILFIGVALVQVAQLSKDKISDSIHEQKPLIGLFAIVIACCLSGFAGVYFEKILKGSDISVWMRNIQLCVSSIPLGLFTVYIIDNEEVSSKGFFHGYNLLVWFVILLQAIGGLVVAVVVKFADNILKGFSTSLAIILSCVVSVYAFNFHLTGQFVIGASLVIGSIFLYSKPHNPQLAPHKK